jgi:hypothetical protein
VAVRPPSSQALSKLTAGHSDAPSVAHSDKFALYRAQTFAARRLL